MSPAGAFTIDALDPALAGHFPDDPIVPGVMLLDRAVLAVAAGRRVAGLPAVKFLRPVRPGDRVEILSEPAGADRVAFVCRVADEDAVRGAILLAPAP